MTTFKGFLGWLSSRNIEYEHKAIKGGSTRNPRDVITLKNGVRLIFTIGGKYDGVLKSVHYMGKTVYTNRLRYSPNCISIPNLGFEVRGKF